MQPAAQGPLWQQEEQINEIAVTGQLMADLSWLLCDQWGSR
jgi:hypothetical protein